MPCPLTLPCRLPSGPFCALSPRHAPDHTTDCAEQTPLLEPTRAVFAADGPLAESQPGYRPRAGQQEMAEAIADAIDARAALMVDAGTGIGKTFAYLVPALLSRQKVLLSTATRQLQDQLYQRDVPRIKQVLGSDAQVAILKGRANYVCPVHLARNLRDGRFRDPKIPARLRIIERFAALSDTGDRAACTQLSEEDPAWAFATSTRDNCLGQDCPELRRCPLMHARQQAQKADVLVVNHHLFCADLAMKDDAMADFLPRADILIFDEAHQLPDIATEFFGNTFSTRQLLELGRESQKIGNHDAPGLADWPGLYKQLEAVAGRLRLALPSGLLRLGLEELLSADAQDVNEWLVDVLPDVDDALEAHLQTLKPLADSSADLGHLYERTQTLLERLRHWHTAFLRATAKTPDEALILWAQTTDSHAQLRTTPLSVAERFAQAREQHGGAWIFVSATLAVGGSLDHFARLMGMQDAWQLQVESPFNYPDQAALWIPRGLGNPTAPDFPDRVAKQAWPLIRRNRGRAFVLCTTLRAMRQIAEQLRREAGDDIDILMQGEAPRHELMKQFREAEAAVLVGSAGFWEGVDIAGEKLSLVIIDKLPFAPPDDPIYRARSQALQRAGQHPFRELSLPQAMLALKQGAGRLIRTETDHGLLVICDERLRSRSYGAQILASLPPFKRLESFAEALDFLKEEST
ncbi:ATP-dependent DNA helicase [Lautropia dentalis]|uniref:DNA 5'-3' helicase n=1 Tax=Lautropia dentalis TaxID=2490857 RepID=A0A3R8LSD6_9BURK|nr:ATP-dependent DNA helicase [Lautropia dentalis]